MNAVKQLSPEDLLRLLKEESADVNVLDVREDEEVITQPYQGLETIHIPMQAVPNKLKDLNKDVTWVVACRSGGRSQKIAEFLQSQNFNNVYNLAGGVLAWQEIKSL